MRSVHRTFPVGNGFIRSVIRTFLVGNAFMRSVYHTPAFHGWEGNLPPSHFAYVWE